MTTRKHEWKDRRTDGSLRIVVGHPSVKSGIPLLMNDYKGLWFIDDHGDIRQLSEILRLRELLAEVDRDGGVIHTPLRARIRQALGREDDR